MLSMSNLSVDFFYCSAGVVACSLVMVSALVDILNVCLDTTVVLDTMFKPI